MSIVIIKLISGEEVIATKVGDVYSKVKIFQFSQGQDGKPQLGLIPFISIYPEWTGHINTDLVLVETIAPNDIEKPYLQATSSIQLL